MTAPGTQIEGRFIVANKESTPLKLIVEPWADEGIIQPGKKVEITFSASHPVDLEIEIRPGALVLYAWKGAMLSEPPM